MPTLLILLIRGSPANVGMLGIVCSGREICGWAMLVLGAQYTSAPVQGSPFLIDPVLSASLQEPGCSPYQRLCKVLVTHILTNKNVLEQRRCLQKPSNIHFISEASGSIGQKNWDLYSLPPQQRGPLLGTFQELFFSYTETHLDLPSVCIAHCFLLSR